MLVSIISENTYKVGDRILQVGDEVDVTEVPDIDLNGIGSISAADLKQKLVDMNKWIRDTKEALIRRLHLSDAAYEEETAALTWEYVNAHRDWAFYIDVLFKAVEKHMGGGLPLQVDPDTCKISIRTLEKDPRSQTQETLNWTRSMISRQVQFQRYDGVRAVGNYLFGHDSRESMTLDVGLLSKLQLPCITVPAGTSAVNPLIDGESQKDGVVALANAGAEAFKKLQSNAPVCLVWVQEEGYTLVDVRERIMPSKPGQPGTPLPAALPVIEKTLGAPDMVGLLMFGDLSKVADGKRGLIAVSLKKGAQAHCALAVEGEEFNELSSGNGLKTEEVLAEALTALVEKEDA